MRADTAAGSGKNWNVKFTSWNVNGIRAWVQACLHYINQFMA